MTQKKVHERYVKEFSGRVSSDLIKHWEREAERFKLEELTEDFPRSYLEEINRVSNAEVERLLKRKRRELGFRNKGGRDL
ncbi:MAG: hypothetical protein QMC89_05245 [Candidatus Hodarchaeaceae archaeon]|nr:hypothetical protein [Candidatus Hodarchaeaceae archaeon]